MSQGPYVVGIDLGTTNCALAWTRKDLEGAGAHPEVLPIPQRVAAGESETRDQLPSFLYCPPPHEREGDDSSLPSWAGVLAREQVHRTPGRVSTSAKSWLSASSVDRLAPILPWKGEEDVTRLSPVEVSASFLRHLRWAWDRSMAPSEPGHRLENQLVVLTVPASFDAVARDLTLDAARRAGLPQVLLLEEPLAAFYAWMSERHRHWRNILRQRSMVLIVDVGGGTTDFTLLRMRPIDGRLCPERHAVGEHLLAGGDNIDLALARSLEARLSPAPLDLLRFASLTASCRTAKECLLAPDGPESMPITVLGRGSSLVGGSSSCELQRDELRQIVLDGFFPPCTLEEPGELPPRSGLVELGLPYASDPAITRNLARFLREHLDEETPFPSAVLFNGGSLRPDCVRARVLDCCRSWLPSDARERGIVDLGGTDLSLAVARGAARYGMTRLGQGTRVRGGSRRSYYMGLGDGAGEALCVLPASAEEGETFPLEEQGLHVLRGRPVRFSLFTSHRRPKDEIGLRLDPVEAGLSRLPALHTVLPAGTDPSDSVPVRLEAGLGDVGTLEIHCIERENDTRHRLRFELGTADAEEARRPSPSGDDGRLQRAREQLRKVFERSKAQSPKKDESPKSLSKTLETLLEKRRNAWSLELCRSLWEDLADLASRRRRSQEDEITWFHLCGFCLRPGIGAPLDDWRIARMTPLLDEGMQRRKHDGVRLAWWIFWRRLSAGLAAPVQSQLFDAIAPKLLPGMKHLQRGPTPTVEELREIWRLAGSCESLPLQTKERLGRAALAELKRARTADVACWTLARVCARRPFGPSLHAVLPSEVALPLIQSLFEGPWREHPSGPLALLESCRLTGHRDLDLPEAFRESVRRELLDFGMAAERLEGLRTIQEGERDDSTALFGESLPEGLRLAP